VLNTIVVFIHDVFFNTVQLRTHDFVDKEHGEVRVILSQDEVMNCGLGFATDGHANIPKQIIVAFPHSKNTINNTTR
jgi:hypothetical protein